MPRENPNALWERKSQKKSRGDEGPMVRRLRRKLRELGVVDWDAPLCESPKDMLALVGTLEGIMRERGVTAQKALSIYSRRVHG